MANSKRNFIQGKMDLDSDERLLPMGVYREAENIDVINSEGSDLGAVENVLSNKRLTYFDVGANPFDLGKFQDQKNHKLYWFTVSDNGAFLFEWDDYNQVQSVVLADTRPIGNGRVLDLNKDNLITGIGKVYSQDGLDDLLLAVDDNIEPLCINIERAKTYGENGFDKEDIYLIKKPPSFAPKCTLIFDGTPENFIEDKFFCFAYRYRYLDGEYSALSSISQYQFNAVGYNVDYFDCINRGMVNSFNAVNIKFNTGDKRVTEIQVIAKQSNSNTPYIVETFNKEILGWGNDEIQSFNFYNNKIYTVLPEKELYRLFDNVPLKAKALTIVDNIPLLGNYLEGFDLINKDGGRVKMQHSVSFNSYGLESEYDFVTEIDNTSNSILKVTAPLDDVFLEGYSIGFLIAFEIQGIEVYRNSFQFVMERDYTGFTDLFADPVFIEFINAINLDILNNYNANNEYNIGVGMIVVTNPYIEIITLSGFANFVLYPLVIDVETGTSAEETLLTQFIASGTDITITRSGTGKSCKTNRNYAVDIVYKDEFKRTTTVLTSLHDTVYIPQLFSDQTNKLQITIPHNPPIWAKYFSIAVKCDPLTYQQVMITQFFQDGNFTWCLLQGDNKDKVKAGDLLIPKSAPQTITTIQYITVLEVRDQEKNFLSDNLDNEGNDLIEPSGVYMKIRPSGINMDASKIDIYSDSDSNSSKGDNYPKVYIDLFSVIDGGTTTHLPIPQGTYIYLKFKVSRKQTNGWNRYVYEKEFFANTNYDSIEDWINDNLLNGSVNFAYTVEGSEQPSVNLVANFEVLKGTLSKNAFGKYVLTESPTGKAYLEFTSNRRGSASRSAYIDGEILVRVGQGEFIFETAPIESNINAYYEAQEFEIVDNYHLGNTQDQDVSNPAIIELDFFNCFVFGNGVESYRVRDSVLGNALNIDTRPNATSVEPYRAIRRFADWTYGEAFIESVGVNGINVFNLSTANFKEGDKQYGSIQILHTRDTDIISIQERKAFRLLFGKDLITSAQGFGVISKTPEILGEKIAYLGDNGIGLHPESFAVDAYRAYYYCPDSATPIRLSLDGAEEINNGLVDFFRDLTIESFGSKKIGGYDPHKKMYALSSETELTPEFNVGCGNSIYKLIAQPFTYNFNLNDLIGDIVINYEVISGEVDIEVDYDSVITQELGVTTTGTITIPRTNTSILKAVVTLTPVSETAIIQITNICPLGTPLKLIQITLCDEDDLGKTITNRHSWGASSLYSKNILFEVSEINNFVSENGLEGVGKFPLDGETVNLQSYKSPLNTGLFLSASDNKLGYLVTDSEYDETDIATILTEATFLATSQSVLGTSSTVDFGNFVFNRPSLLHNLYLIWDYRNAIIAPPCDSGMDVVFVFDYTASMSGQIEAAKTGVAGIISTIETQSGTNDYRLGLVIVDEYSSGTVSNYSSNAEYTSLPSGQKFIKTGVGGKFQWITAMEMMSLNNEATFTTQLNKLNGTIALGSGSGTPEPTDIAISKVIEDDFVNAFRDNVARYLVVITDASSGGDDDVNDALDVIEINRLKGVCISKLIKVIVLGGGVNTSTGGVYSWRELATDTGGSWNTSYDATTIQNEIISNCTIVNPLTAFTVNTIEDACIGIAGDFPVTYYHDGANPYPQIGDRVFYDSIGTSPVTSSTFITSEPSGAQTDLNGYLVVLDCE